MRLLNFSLLATALMGFASAAHAQADHLILSEVLINSPGTESNVESAEFVEVFNPTANPIDLSTVYFCDDNVYSTLPATPAGISLAATADNLLRFPAGTILPSGGVAVVTCHATRFLTEYFGGSLANYGAGPSKLLFEVAESDASVANMTSLNTNPDSQGQTNFSRTNGAEFLVLFQWDGSSDLVKDLDIVSWGAPTGASAYSSKGGTQVDGPDGDSATSTYAAEAGSTTNLSIATTAPAGMTRTTIVEASEVASGGNGATGNDETTEVIANSWTGHADSAATPGTTTLVPSIPSSVADWTQLDN